MPYEEVFKRKEVKYRLSGAQADAMREAISAAMTPDSYGRTTVTSVYYDTPRRDLIVRSLEKPWYKEKIRLRVYGHAEPATPVFVELKKKCDGITYKRRVAASRTGAALVLSGVPYAHACRRRPILDVALAADSLSAEHLQIGAEIDAFVARHAPLRPSMTIAYERVAWAPVADDACGVRITFDERIRYRDLFDPADASACHLLLGAGEVMMEVKVARAYPLWLVHALDAAGARPSSFSKYGEAFRACQAPAPARVALRA